MTICEYIKDKYDEFQNTPNNKKSVIISYDVGTWEYFKAFCEYVCCGGWDYQFLNAGVTKEQLEKAVNDGYMKKNIYSNWANRQRGQTLAYTLTVKGMRAMYRAYKWN